MGSHLRLITNIKGEYHITIPKHKSLKIEMLNKILSDVSQYLDKTKEELISELFR